nr:hypothetical protein [Halomonas xinjiangensis]
MEILIARGMLRHGQRYTVPFGHYACPLLFLGHAKYPINLGFISFECPATGRSAITTPVIIHPVTENGSISVVVSGQASTY